MIRNLVQADHNKLPCLAFHTMNLCDDFIVIYGGVTESDKVLGDLIFLRPNKAKFLLASYENNKSYFPKPRHSHSAVYYAPQKKLYIFGGIVFDNPRYTDELWTLDVSTKPIFKMLFRPEISIRCRQVSFICRRKVFIYGGFGVYKITQKYQILNDLYAFDIDEGSEKTNEIITKGGIDMNNFLFKVIRLTEDRNETDDLQKPIQFAFFCSDMTQFFVFDIDTETFTKVMPKFYAHSNRENFSINKLSDGRIILFGGMNETLCFNEAFALISFSYTQKDRYGKNIEDELHYSWNDVDLYGYLNDDLQKESGYNGHASIVLPNDHILIFGGTEQSYFPVYNNYKFSNEDPVFTRRFKIIDVFNTYKWDPPLSNL
jgi:hypothetical protein